MYSVSTPNQTTIRPHKLVPHCNYYVILISTSFQVLTSILSAPDTALFILNILWSTWWHYPQVSMPHSHSAPTSSSLCGSALWDATCSGCSLLLRCHFFPVSTHPHLSVFQGLAQVSVLPRRDSPSAPTLLTKISLLPLYFRAYLVIFPSCILIVSIPRATPHSKFSPSLV